MARGTQRISGRELERRVRRLAAQAINISADDVLARAIPITPLEESTLRGSGHVVEAEPDNLRAEVRFSTPYAASQHEGGWETGPLAGVRIKNYTTPGTGPKYLETPFKQMAPRYRAFVDGVVKKGIGLSR